MKIVLTFLLCAAVFTTCIVYVYGSDENKMDTGTDEVRPVLPAQNNGEGMDVEESPEMRKKREEHERLQNAHIIPIYSRDGTYVEGAVR